MHRCPHFTVTRLCALLSLASACGDDDTTGEKEAKRPEGAVLVAERFNTPDGRAAYMGAFPELPSGEIDISQMVELGPEGDAFACAGSAFFFNPDDGTITKYEVEDDLSLTKATSIDVAQEGIIGWTGAHVCASDQQAFIINGTGGRAVEYDPTTMIIADAFDLPLPDVSKDLELQFFEPKIAGKLAYFPLAAINWDTVATAPRAMLAVFDLEKKTVSYEYDDRAQATLGGFVDSKGNFYQLPEDGGFFRLYSPTKNLPKDCVLRARAGSASYDEDYILCLNEGESLRSMWPIDDEHVLATLIDEADAPAPKDLWDWYNLAVTPTMINLKTGERTPYNSVPNVQPMNSRKIVLDGKSYYQVYSFDADGLVTKIELVELDVEGARRAFTLKGGDILTLERLW